MRKRRVNGQKEIKLHVHTSRIFIVGVLIFATTILNSLHNWSIVETTKARKLQVDSWDLLTKNDWFLEEINSGDIFLSRTQDNAYETNAGQFYYKSGIRLGGLIQPRLIWPEYELCKIEDSCKLENLRERTQGVIENLKRANPVESEKSLFKVQFRRNIGDTQDWVEQYLDSNMIADAHFWNFEIYPLTPFTVVAYLMPIIDANPIENDKFNLKLILLTKGSSLEFRPSANNVCLERVDSEVKNSNRGEEYFVSQWVYPERKNSFESPNKSTLDEIPDSILGQLQVGSCG